MFPVFFFPFSRYLNCFCKSDAGNNVVVVACIPAKKAACYWFLFAPPLSDNSPAGRVLLVKLTWGPEVDLLRTWSAQRSSSWSSLTLSFLDGTFGILSYAVLIYGWKTSCSVFQDRFATWDLLWFCFRAEPKRVWWRRPVAVGPALPADGLHIRAWQGCEASGQEEAVHRLCREPRLHGWRDDWSAEIKTYDTSAIYREKKNLFSGFTPCLQVDTPLAVWPSWRMRRIFWLTLEASRSASSLCGCPPGLRQASWPSGGIEQVRKIVWNHAWRMLLLKEGRWWVSEADFQYIIINQNSDF